MIACFDNASWPLHDSWKALVSRIMVDLGRMFLGRKLDTPRGTERALIGKIELKIL